ncbi:MAG: citrate transporter [Clostridia bacterium]|nr:citrate transporter [Clostridia bacterium]
MSETVVGILGFICIIAIVFTLFKSLTQPSIAFIVFPALLALILVIGGYYTFGNVASLIKSGFSSTGPTAALFVFSVLFFGIMTAVIALVGHLDGGGASTFCIVVPAMLPIYKKMHMRKSTLLRIAVLAMGVLNLMPWAGPTMRAASVLGMEAGNLWKTLLPIQIFGIVLVLAHAVLAGFQEKRRGAGLNSTLALEESSEEASEDGARDSELARPKLFVVNVLLTIAVIAMLIWDEFPSYVPFMLGTALALFINYGFSGKMHKKIINLHAGPALMMCSTLMGAAVLMGVLVKTVTVNDVEVASVVSCMSNIITQILPDFLGRHLPLVIGILSVPLALAFDTDSYFYGMLPVMIGIGEGFGISALPIAIAMVVCRNCATFISPMVPATLLGVGLAEVDIKDHIKASFFYVWGFSILCLIFAVIIGLIPF